MASLTNVCHCIILQQNNKYSIDPLSYSFCYWRRFYVTSNLFVLILIPVIRRIGAVSGNCPKSRGEGNRQENGTERKGPDSEGY